MRGRRTLMSLISPALDNSVCVFIEIDVCADDAHCTYCSTSHLELENLDLPFPRTLKKSGFPRRHHLPRQDIFSSQFHTGDSRCRFLFHSQFRGCCGIVKWMMIVMWRRNRRREFPVWDRELKTFCRRKILCSSLIGHFI